MPIAFLIIGIAIALAAFRNTHAQLGKLLAGDFQGTGNFGYWIAAIVIIGMLGYLPYFAGPSRALLALIVLSIFLANGGFFAKLNSALAESQNATVPTQEPPAPGPLTVSISGGSSGSSGAGGILGSVVGAVVKGAAGRS